jgi:uncharacterized protein YdaL
VDPAVSRSATLVLYDGDGPWGWLGETYAIAAGHLASHFGAWEARPVSGYQVGDMHAWTAVVYVGSTYDAPLPETSLDDVLAGGTPVVWLAYNLWALEQRDPWFAARYGFTAGSFDAGPFAEVRYKGRALTRSLENVEGIVGCVALDVERATVLATAVRDDATELPWALRSGDLTYVAENPFAYVTESDRYLAFADLLFDALAPDTPERHRALVRLEDVTPVDDPARLRRLADVLYARCVPFSVAVVPEYRDPLGAYSSDGQPEVVRLRDAPEVAEALAYMVARGGELVLHGYTHQHAAEANPYSGVSGDDFEFWRTHVDADDFVVYDGPVEDDSPQWARGRVLAGLAELEAAGLPAPIAFEYPHYAGSAIDSRAIAAIVPTAYHRGFYFPGALSGSEDLARPFGQLFPFVITDVFGWRVIPENVGNYQPFAYNAGVETRLVADLVRNAEANLVVRDGFASFFFHPFFEPEVLASIVTGIQGLGYEFVRAGSVVAATHVTAAASLTARLSVSAQASTSGVNGRRIDAAPLRAPARSATGTSTTRCGLIAPSPKSRPAAAGRV